MNDNIIFNIKCLINLCLFSNAGIYNVYRISLSLELENSERKRLQKTSKCKIFASVHLNTGV